MYREPLKITLRQMQYLLAVAELGSFRKAALQCRVAQPSLSAQIAAAESSIGVRLLERDLRHVRVTDAGKEFIERARKVLVEVSDMQKAASRYEDPLTGPLRLGVIPTISPYLLPEVVPLLLESFPDLTITWTEEKTETLVQQIRSGHLDGAIVAEPAELLDLPTHTLFDDPFVLAVPSRHPLARHRQGVKLPTLEGEKLLLLTEGHCFREQAISACSRSNLEELSFRATSLSTLVQMVASGAGLTLLPKLSVETETRRADIQVLPLAAPGAKRTIVLTCRPGGFREPAILALVERLKRSSSSW